MLDAHATTQWFFDRAEVKARIDPAVRKALSKVGAFVRTRARTSIRTRKAVSAPGSPPSSHTGTLKKLIYFSFDPQAKSVVIGPTLGGSESGAPAALEYGGTAVVKDGAKSRTVSYQPRPYMAPALAAELPALVDEFKDFIGG